MNWFDVLVNPRSFFTALKELKPHNSRFVWLVLLYGLIAGLATALAQRPVNALMEGMPMLPSPMLSVIFSVVTMVVVGLLFWLLLWGLGQVGTGREGRPAEVYGASFLPGLLLSLIMLPLSVFLAPELNIPKFNGAGLEGEALIKAIQTYTKQIQTAYNQQPITKISQVINMVAVIWQFAVAWIGFQVMTGERGKALKGVLIPLGVTLLLVGAFWLIGKAMSGMVSV